MSEVVVPLLSMQQSVLLCISTILDSGNHYSKMMEMTDDYGNNIFETIKITLVCDDCLKTDHPEKCRHKLASMPRWLSSKKVETVRALLAEDPVRVALDTLERSMLTPGISSPPLKVSPFGFALFRRQLCEQLLSLAQHCRMSLGLCFWSLTSCMSSSSTFPSHLWIRECTLQSFCAILAVLWVLPRLSG